MHIPFQTCSLSIAIMAGCAMPEFNTKDQSAEAVSRSTLSPEENTHRFDYWHEEATELHEMAARREREADMLSKNKQETSGEELVIRMRVLAKQLHAAAEYADEQAQEAQRQSTSE
jgi:hypothetical protein